MKPKALIFHATGTNRDHDVAAALTTGRRGSRRSCRSTNCARAKRCWQDYQLLVIPGGFSYADALGAGKLLALDLHAYFAEEVAAFVASGKPVIGICNGFQALVKSGILPSATVKTAARTAASHTDLQSAQGHFECRWVTLKPVSQNCIWTRGLDELIDCPVRTAKATSSTCRAGAAGRTVRPAIRSRWSIPARMAAAAGGISRQPQWLACSISPGSATRRAMCWA